MDYKTYSENSVIELELVVHVNGDRVAKVITDNTDSLQEQLHKVDKAIKKALEQQFYDLEGVQDEN
jgi:hypothetical protein